MPAKKTRANDTQFKIYVDKDELEKFQKSCDGIGQKYSEAVRRLIGTFNIADESIQAWMVGLNLLTKTELVSLIEDFHDLRLKRLADAYKSAETMKTDDTSLGKINVAGGARKRNSKTQRL